MLIWSYHKIYGYRTVQPQAPKKGLHGGTYGRHIECFLRFELVCNHLVFSKCSIWLKLWINVLGWIPIACSTFWGISKIPTKCWTLDPLFIAEIFQNTREIQIFEKYYVYKSENRKYWFFVLEARVASFLNFQNLFSFAELCNFEITFGALILKLWNFEALKRWNLEILKLRNFEIWEYIL